MSANRPSYEEGVLRGIGEVVKEAEKQNGPWPRLDEPSFCASKRWNFGERVTLWTMVGVIGAVTVGAIATGSQYVEMALVTLATGTLVRLARRPAKQQPPGKESHDQRSTKRRQSG
jgi:hypothetical protein